MPLTAALCALGLPPSVKYALQLRFVLHLRSDEAVCAHRPMSKVWIARFIASFAGVRFIMLL